MTASAVECEYRLLRGWAMSHGPLTRLRECFTYTDREPGRATGYLYDAGGRAWPPGEERGWPEPFATTGDRLLDRLEADLGLRFTVVAFQAYLDGTGTGWHSDPQWDAQAILSLGVTRGFEFRPAGGGEVIRLALHHGDLLFMPSGFQAGWEHQVPVEDVAGERCSIVFRTALPA